MTVQVEQPSDYLLRLLVSSRQRWQSLAARGYHSLTSSPDGTQVEFAMWVQRETCEQRLERRLAGSSETVVTIWKGDAWWSYRPGVPLRSNAEGLHVGHDGHWSGEAFLDPVRLLSSYDLTEQDPPSGQREALVVIAARRSETAAPSLFPHLSHRADLRLHLDPHTGVLLKIETRVPPADWRIDLELLSVQYAERFPRWLFTP